MSKRQPLLLVDENSLVDAWTPEDAIEQLSREQEANLREQRRRRADTARLGIEERSASNNDTAKSGIDLGDGDDDIDNLEDEDVECIFQQW